MALALSAGLELGEVGVHLLDEVDELAQVLEVVPQAQNMRRAFYTVD